MTTQAVRGIEHVGITVPDVEAAARFLIDAFGAEVLYDMPAPERAEGDPYPDEQARLGTRPGARWITTKVLRLGDGPGIELFEYADDEQRPRRRRPTSASSTSPCTSTTSTPHGRPSSTPAARRWRGRSTFRGWSRGPAIGGCTSSRRGEGRSSS